MSSAKDRTLDQRMIPHVLYLYCMSYARESIIEHGFLCLYRFFIAFSAFYCGFSVHNFRGISCARKSRLSELAEMPSKEATSRTDALAFLICSTFRQLLISKSLYPQALLFLSEIYEVREFLSPAHFPLESVIEILDAPFNGRVAIEPRSLGSDRRKPVALHERGKGLLRV